MEELKGQRTKIKELYYCSGFLSVNYSITALSKERLVRLSYYLIDTSAGLLSSHSSPFVFVPGVAPSWVLQGVTPSWESGISTHYILSP